MRVIGDLNDRPVRFDAQVVMPGRVLRTNGYVVDTGHREAGAHWRYDTSKVALRRHALELETVDLKLERLAGIPGVPSELSTRQLVDVIEALEELDPDQRRALAAVFPVWEKGVQGARDTLGDEDLEKAYDELIRIVISQ